MERLRITYTKTAALRYTSNLDIHRIWERSLRRAHLPLAYSQGFHPQPKLIQACPLPLGLTSHAEMIDVWLETETTPAELTAALQPAMPPGLELQKVEPVELLAPSLPKQVTSADYIATMLDPVDETELAGRVSTLLAAAELRREYRGKSYDMRPLVEDLRLMARESATGRTDEVLSALGYDPYDVRVDRVKLILG
jgi:radical SAM-linked protein